VDADHGKRVIHHFFVVHRDASDYSPPHLIDEVSPMFPRKNSGVIAVLFCVAMVACTPAHFVQQVRELPAQCEVRVCVNPQTGLERCICQSSAQTRRLLWEAGLLERNE
jgi:hypothetical protein